MSPEEQRIAIAKACGWTHQTEGLMWNENLRCARIIQGSHLADVRKKMQLPMDNCYIPDYLNDLNAMVGATTAVLTHPSQQHRFYQMLVDILDRNPDGSHRFGAAVYWETTNATAAQRAEAFLRTLNLWTDNK